VYVLPAQGRIHDGGREGMPDGISDYAIDSGSDVELLDAVDGAQLLGGDLSGRGFLPASGRGESEGAACAHSQDPADESLLAHTHTHNWMAVALAGEEANPSDVLAQGGGSVDDLVAFRRVSSQLLQGFLRFLR